MSQKTDISLYFKQRNEQVSCAPIYARHALILRVKPMVSEDSLSCQLLKWYESMITKKIKSRQYEYDLKEKTGVMENQA